MDLSKKKKLVKRLLGVGEARIVFLESKMDEIKDAITKQDIRDLQKSGAILIKEVKGRKFTEKSKRRDVGNVKKKVNKRKRRYVDTTRKMRAYLKGIDPSLKISKEEIKNIRKKIKNKEFRSKAHLRESIMGVKK